MDSIGVERLRLLSDVVPGLVRPRLFAIDSRTRLKTTPPRELRSLVPTEFPAQRIIEEIAPADRGRYLAAVAQSRTEPLTTTVVEMCEGAPLRLDVVNLRDDIGMIVALFSTPDSKDLTAPDTITRADRTVVSGGMLLRVSGEVIEMDPELTALLGWQPEEMVGRSALDLVHPDDHGELIEHWAHTLENPGRPLHLRVRIEHGDKRWGWTDLFAWMTDQQGEEHDRCQVVLVDVDQEVTALEALRDRARLDHLTGLANRWNATRFLERLEGPSAVVFLDLDKFKAVNDSLGHAAGDALLVATAQHLAEVIRPADLLARLGGDEFIVIAPGCGEDHAVALANRLAEAARRPLWFEGTEITTSASVGVACGHDRGIALLAEADRAMYEAKRIGDHQPVLFDAEMKARLDQLNGLVSQLSDDTVRLDQHFTFHHQAIVDLSTGAVVGFEAFLRSTDPGSSTPPHELLGAIESARRLDDLTHWTIRAACESICSLRETLASPGLSLNINVSAVQLTTPGLVERVEERLAETGLDPSHLVFEVTETNRLTSYSQAVEVLGALRQRGIRVVLDDFGASWSTFEQLLDIEADIIKLDAQLTRRVGHDRTEHLIDSLVDLCAKFGTVVAAEGVESNRQSNWLATLGVTTQQGWLFGRALPLDRIPDEIGSRGTRLADQIAGPDALGSAREGQPASLQGAARTKQVNDHDDQVMSGTSSSDGASWSNSARLQN